MRASPLLFACILAPAAAYALDELPKRKPGLWQIDTKMNAMPAGMGPMEMCIDEKTDNLVQQSAGDASAQCEKMTAKKEGDAFVVRSVCKMGGSTTTTEGKFTGQFDSNYRGEIHVAYDPPVHGMDKSDMVISAKWLGPCKAGQKPGDMTMPGGAGMPKSINVEDLTKMRDQMKRMRPH